MKIGDIVEVDGYVTKGKTYGSRETTLIAQLFPEKRTVMLLGKSFRYTGQLEEGRRGYEDAYEPYYLIVADSHPVWMVMPLAGDRYRTPFPVLESQIVVREEENNSWISDPFPLL